MATNINSAFSEFMHDTVNLDSEVTRIARKSRDWLFEQINLLPSTNTDFPQLVPDYHLHYGSFARRTKARPLDDIDIMIGIHAQSATHTVFSDRVELYANSSSSLLNSFAHDYTNRISSIKIINRFVKCLSKVHQYKNAQINRRQEAAVLNLSSYDWSYDILPCFMASGGYYLIPDGNGNWKKTDPRIDKKKVEEINQKNDGNVLNMIRAFKHWNSEKLKKAIPSYLLENLILNYYSNGYTKASEFIDIDFPYILEYLSTAIYNPVSDPKGIEGNINRLQYEQKIAISQAASEHLALAKAARNYEAQGDHRNCIYYWGRVFGNKFPVFG